MKARAVRASSAVQVDVDNGSAAGPDSQYALRRKAILREVGKILERSDTARFSMTALAAHLDLTSPALYYYFKNKHEMLYEFYKSALDIAEETLVSATADANTASEVLELFVYRYLLTGFVEITPMMALQERTSLTARHQKKMFKQREVFLGKLRAIVARGIREGSIRPCNPKLLVSSIEGVYSTIIRAYVPQGELTKEQVARETVQLLARGWSAPRKR